MNDEFVKCTVRPLNSKSSSLNILTRQIQLIYYLVGFTTPSTKCSEQIRVHLEGSQGFPFWETLLTAFIQRARCSRFFDGNRKNLTVSQSFLLFLWHFTTQQQTMISSSFNEKICFNKFYNIPSSVKACLKRVTVSPKKIKTNF